MIRALDLPVVSLVKGCSVGPHPRWGQRQGQASLLNLITWLQTAAWLF